MTTDARALRAQLSALEERVRRLEEAPGPVPAPVPVPSDNSSGPPAAEDHYWALNGLRKRLGAHPSTAGGAVTIVGSLTLPTGAPVAWQQGAGTTDMLDSEWTEQASVFAALGHPVRLELLRHILAGSTTTAALAAITSLGTTGQLHHHLRQLLAVGWVRQSGRGNYEVPAARIVPLLTSVLGAQR